jgi:hypothetical protein
MAKFSLIYLASFLIFLTLGASNPYRLPNDCWKPSHKDNPSGENELDKPKKKQYFDLKITIFF